MSIWIKVPSVCTHLNNKVRLIDVSRISSPGNCSEFIGFVCGIVSQDHDLEQMYLDSFLKIAQLEGQDITDALEELKKIGELFNINFTISISLDEKDIPETLKENIIVSL